MKRIDVPGDVSVIMNSDNKENMVVTFKEFLEASLDQYEPLGKGYKMAQRGMIIGSHIEQMNGDKMLKLEDEDFDILKKAVDNATFRPAANRRMVPFYEAVKKAQEVKG